MIHEHITQIATIHLKTFEVAFIIQGLSRIETEDARHLKNQFEELYKGMTGKSFGVK